MATKWRVHSLTMGAVLLLFAGCSPSHYRNSADRQVYGLVQEKEHDALGQTNAFTVETRYSSRKPADIPGREIIEERLQSGQRRITLTDALDMAVKSNRTYQSRKEQLYLTALRLTLEQHKFHPSVFANATARAARNSDGTTLKTVTPAFGVDQTLKTGADIGIAAANDVFSYYTGRGGYATFPIIAATLSQPLLRGAGATVVAENLTQADRDLVYEVRSFSHYQNTFAVDVVTSYFRLLQQRDAVRNEYFNYQNLKVSRQRSEALAVDRLPAFQADQALQDELRARSRYVLTVDGYYRAVDVFKGLLALPLGFDISLDDSVLEELKTVGLLPLPLEETEGYELAVKNRLDLLNEVDRFEDSKRKIIVAADSLRTTLNFLANTSFNADNTDYAHFDFNQWRGSVGLQLNLPLDRLSERNVYRTSIVNFEHQIRTLAIFLDDTRNEIRGDLRNLQQTRENYNIQRTSVDLADRRVESAELLLRAGRAQVRDLLDAQAAQLQAKNAVTQFLVDYHVNRMALLLDLGLLRADVERFWVKDVSVPTRLASKPATGSDADVVPPDKLFQN